MKINITVLENEAFKTKLATQIQSGDVPDLFQSWGGATMAQQADAGALKDITADVASWASTVNPGAMSIYQYKGKQYGIPWDMGMIGFWYNKALFAQAGITAPPTTWDEYLAAVKKLKDAGITPLAIAGKDEWPSMHLWTYLVLRNGGGDALAQMVQTGDWNTDACKKAGEDVLALNALNPYQDGFKAATYNNEAAAVGNGKAAMELMGQWAPSVQNDSSADKKGLGDKLGWFAFPAVTGGAGAPTDGVGGGNGIAVGKDAPPEAHRLPEVLHERRQPEQAQHRQRRPLDHRRHRELRHRPEPPGRPRRTRGGAVHAAVPRPGDGRHPGPDVQRRDDGAVRRRVDAREGLPGDHRRRGGAVGSPRSIIRATSERAGPSRPARLHRSP